MKLWENTQFTTAILFCFIFTAQCSEYNVIVRDSEPIRLLELPRSLSVYILITIITRLKIVKLNDYDEQREQPLHPSSITELTSSDRLY